MCRQKCVEMRLTSEFVLLLTKKKINQNTESKQFYVKSFAHKWKCIEDSWTQQWQNVKS